MRHARWLAKEKACFSRRLSINLNVNFAQGRGEMSCSRPHEALMASVKITSTPWTSSSCGAVKSFNPMAADSVPRAIVFAWAITVTYLSYSIVSVPAVTVVPPWPAHHKEDLDLFKFSWPSSSLLHPRLRMPVKLRLCQALSWPVLGLNLQVPRQRQERSRLPSFQRTVPLHPAEPFLRKFPTPVDGHVNVRHHQALRVTRHHTAYTVKLPGTTSHISSLCKAGRDETATVIPSITGITQPTQNPKHKNWQQNSLSKSQQVHR